MIEGCKSWRTERLAPPAAVCTATDDYLQAEDALATWIAERCKTIGYGCTETDVLFKDWKAWREYQTAVFARTGSAIANTPLERFDEIVINERPANAAGSFLFALVPSGPVRLIDAVEAYLFQHASRHLGEIEHARALVGLGGVT